MSETNIIRSKESNTETTIIYISTYYDKIIL